MAKAKSKIIRRKPVRSAKVLRRRGDQFKASGLALKKKLANREARLRDLARLTGRIVYAAETPAEVRKEIEKIRKRILK